MNPNDSSQNNNLNAQPAANTTTTPFVDLTPVGTSAPQPVTPVVPEPVAPAPVAPAAVAPTPVTPVAPTPVNPVAPTPVTPVAPVPATQSVPGSPAVSTGAVTDPNAAIAPIDMNIAHEQAAQMPEQTVINTKKSKGSNIALIIIIALLIAFVFNVDKMAEYYQNYIETGSLKPVNVPTDNLSGGYIVINQADSSINVSNIRFYNFERRGDNRISFTFSSGSKYSDVTSENIYISIFNSEKELLYKELFDPKKEVEVAVSSYSMDVGSDVYESAFYALVKKHTAEDLAQTSSLKCTYTDGQYKYEYTYKFVNEFLDSYDVSKQSIDESTYHALESEYNELKSKINVGYENNTIKYTVNLNTDSEIEKLYEKGVTSTIIKNKEIEKKWTCE